jgi:nucleotide-binding universal stress UspA family protein
MYRSVLLPLDGSPFSEQALPLALALVKRSGGRLELVHVHRASIDEEWEPVTPFRYEGLEQSEREWNGHDVKRESEYLSSFITDDAFNVAHYKVLEGDVVKSLEDEIAESDPDLIVMATHGRSGSIADTLVREVHKPIMLIRAHEAAEQALELGTEHILVPLDGSRMGESVLKHALELAEMDKTRITLLRVVQPAYVGPEFTINVQSDVLLEERVEAAHSYLNELRTELGMEGFLIDTDVVVATSAGNAILDYARNHDVNIICMATHGHSGVKRLLLGSVTDKVLRGTTLPILLYRP